MVSVVSYLMIFYSSCGGCVRYHSSQWLPLLLLLPLPLLLLVLNQWYLSFSWCCLCWISDTSHSLDAVCNVRTTSIGESGIVPGEDLSAERPQSKALLQQCKTSKSRWRTCICYLCCVLPCWRSSTNAIFLIELLITIWCTKYLLVLLFLFFGWPYVLFLPWFLLLPVPGSYDPLRQENQGARWCCIRYCKLVAYDYYAEVYRVSVVAILLGVWMSW